VSHTDPEILALRALGEPAGAARDDEHATTCPQCRAELARLTEIVSLARDAGPAGPLDTPPARVWDQIAAAAGTGAAAVPVPAEPSDAQPHDAQLHDAQLHDAQPHDTQPRNVEPRKASGARRRWGTRRGRLATALVGLAAGLIIGIGGAAGIIQLTRAPAASVVAHIQLSPLPQFPQWQGASGTAVMRATSRQQVMVVTLSAPQRSGFYEVWLLARDGVSMISLGDLNNDHIGTFTIPPGTDLHNYSRIDVSLQPFDGSTVHVKTSVVRGSLPTAALGPPTSAS
jgi:hypothetical protein